MAADLVIAPEAEQDIAEAFAWYEKKREGLGEQFLENVEARIQAIRRTPLMHQIVYENFRRSLVARFPYAVFYEYANDVVTVYCVFHTSRDPMKWQSRLP
jgi:plasmid stabilization system protein ParE